jgi:hypothetical protein
MQALVTVPYTTLLSSPLSLTSEIGELYSNLFMPIVDQFLEEAFGSHPSSLGIIVVRDLPPEYAAYRERLLKLSYKFAHLDENIRESYSDPTSKYRSNTFILIAGSSLINSQLWMVPWKSMETHLSYFAFASFPW